MAFFQNSVINKYIQNLDKQTLQNAYAKFRAHFHNATIQENIRGSKEEQYQGEFLIDLFVNVLGYTKNPTPNFNLTTEYKNVKDSKKADGAIIINEIVKAVIELKGTNTTDLNKIEVQAFGYKNNQPECEYVITSNFEKLRFYVDNAIEYLEFNLFILTEKEFELLYICLSYDSIAKGLPKQIKDESVSQEALITKKLYNDYSVFKSELYHSLVKLNPQYEPLELFKKSQKLLDRFLFIFFAEDRQLLPTNLIFRINKEWQQLREMRIEVSLYDRYKIYFNDLDQGAKVSLPAFSQTASKQKEEFQIYAYNGGLFKHDDLLNDVKIDDDLLFTYTEKLSNYDFASEVDVNVLGHIFENSLNDVDEIKAQLEGQEIDKTKTKRKKDGVFYTPKYITKYIVDNTVGKLCLEKKEALLITESDYTIDKKRQKKTTQALTDKLNEYRNWLLQLTICDPACGSGAFLNQALDFLITEHRYIDELQAKLFGDALVLSDVEGSILENNLFGVDINEESVEIAKLSLWLRTAQPNRKLNDLSNNIKCGNSLIDDVSVAGDKAFNWQNEFQKTFENGGFDVIIGNPPYVFTRGNSYFNEIKEFIWRTYPNNQGKINLYGVFLELSLTKLLNKKGFLGFITPETFIRTSTYQEVRKFTYKNYNIKSIELYGNGVFENVTAESLVMVIENDFSVTNEILFKKFDSKQNILYTVKQNSFDLTPQNRFAYDSDNNDELIYSKLKQNSINLGLIVDTRNGVATKAGKNDFISQSKLTDKYKKLLEAPEIFRYGFNWKGNFINYDKEALHRPRKEETFLADKILVQRVASKLVCAFDNEQYFTFNSINNLVLINNEFDLKYIITLLNSKLINFYYRKQFSFDAGFTITVTKENLDIIPIKNIPSNEQVLFIENADKMILFNKEFQELSQKFHRSLQRKFEFEDLPKKLLEYYLHSYSDFIKELAKKKVKLSLSDEAEWEEYFNTESKKALELKSKIDGTDKEIDQMVYKLYDLTDEEIKIVEG